MLKLLVELFIQYEKRKYSSSQTQLDNSADGGDQEKEKKEDMQGQGDCQRTLQVSR